MKLFQLLQYASESLRDADVPEPEIDTEILWNHITGMNKMQMLLNRELEIDIETEDRFLQIIKNRATRRPLQYITGTQNFMGIDFLTAKDVLIPRMDTETLVEQVLMTIRKYEPNKMISVLDLCCGSGCIGLSLKVLTDFIDITLADISDSALALTRRNAEKLGLECEIVKGNLFENVKKRYDIIVSNPPYIRSDVIDGLMPEVKDFEPRLALDGMEDGLYFYKKIIEESEKYINNEGYLFFEIGNDQAYDVQQLLVDNHYADVCVVKDLSGNDRVVYGKRCCI